MTKRYIKIVAERLFNRLTEKPTVLYPNLKIGLSKSRCKHFSLVSLVKKQWKPTFQQFNFSFMKIAFLSFLEKKIQKVMENPVFAPRDIVVRILN